MDIEQALRDAQAAAQSAFHDMLDAQAYAMPDHQLTKRYVAAERVVDSLLGYGHCTSLPPTAWRWSVPSLTGTSSASPQGLAASGRCG
jgi:hypothetical protein